MQTKPLVPLVAFITMVATVSCSPSESDIATAIAQTQAANPTQTPTSVPANTSTPTETPTPTATPSPTPDTRVIDVNPHEMLMDTSDLPTEARYYLPDYSWISPHRNSEVVSGWGVNEGREYLERTGRVDGWWVAYLRGTRTVTAPEEVYDNVVLFRTVDGAALVLAEYSTCRDPESGYVEIEDPPLIGDQSRACTLREMQPSGRYRVWYRLELTFRNYFHAVVGYGWEEEVRPDFIHQVAQALVARLEAAPLSEEVSFQP